MSKLLHKTKLLLTAIVAFAAGGAAWADTPLAVWNGDFSTATTRNGVTFSANDNTIAEDGSTVTIADDATTGISFTLPSSYSYITAVFTVSGISGSASEDGVLVSTMGGDSVRGGVYIAASSLSAKALNGTTAWSTTTYDGTLTSYTDNENTDRTFCLTQCQYQMGSPYGLHLYEVYGGGTAANVVYGGSSNSELKYSTAYNVITIGGFQTAPTDESAIGAMEGLVIKSVAIYASNSGYPLDSDGRANFAMPTPVIVSEATAISSLNTSYSGSTAYFVNFTGDDDVYLTADATLASNITLPYGVTTTLSDTTIAISGSEVGFKLGSSITAVTGDGLVVYESTDTLPTSSLFGDGWTGTVKMSGVTLGSTSLAYFGNDSSTIYLDGDGVTFDEVSADMTIASAISGDGAITVTATPSTQYTVFLTGDFTDFAGSVTLASSGKARVAFGTGEYSGSNNCLIIRSDASVTLASDKTWTVPGGIVVRGNLTLAGTIASGTVYGNAGDGVITVANSTAASSLTLSSNWYGTVKIAYDPGNTAFVINNFGTYSGSTIEIVGSDSTFSAFPSTGSAAPSVTAKVKLTANWTVSNGWDSQTTTFAYLTGEGNLIVNGTTSGTTAIPYTITKIEDYTGSLGGSRGKFTIGTIVSSAEPTVGTKLVSASSTYTKAPTVTTVSVEYGDDTYDGVQLAYQNSDGLYVTAVATDSSSNTYPTLAAAIDAAEEGDTITITATTTNETITVDKNITIEKSGSVYLNAASIAITEGKTLTFNSAMGAITVGSITGGGNIACTVGNTLQLVMTGGTYNVGDITTNAGLLLQGYGTINASGDIDVTGAMSVSDVTVNVTGTIDAASVNLNPSNIDGRNRMNASSGGIPDQTCIIADTINAQVYGSGIVKSTTGAVLLGSSTASQLIGTINAPSVTVSGSGTTTLYGTNNITGTLTISSGSAVTLGDPYSLGTKVRDYDASSSTIVEDEDGYVTAITDSVGGTVTCTPVSENTATVVENNDDVFGGRKVIKVPRLKDGGTTATSHDMVTFLVWKVGSLSAYTSPLFDTTLTSSKTKHGIQQHNGTAKPYEFDNAGVYNDSSYIYIDGVSAATPSASEQVLTVCGNWMINTSSGGYMQFGANIDYSYIAEVLVYFEDFTIYERQSIESALMQKWGIGSATYTPLSTTAAVAMNTGSVLDLGGLSQTVKSVTGSGTVQNGTLTVTDAITLSAGDVLVLPYSADYTLGTVAATIVDSEESTITLYGSLADAIKAQAAGSTGTLTITATATEVDLGTTEISGVTATLADDVTAPTFAAALPYAATWTDGEDSTGTIANARQSAQTFIWNPQGDSTDFATASNWLIGEATATAAPGSTDTVTVNSAASMSIAADAYCASMTLNANLTLTGDGSAVFYCNGYSGEGTFVLGNGSIISATAETTIANSLQIASGATAEIYHSLFLGSNKSLITISGTLTGDTTSVLNITSVYSGDSYGGITFSGTCSGYYGTINEVQPTTTSTNAKRNSIVFVDSDFSNASVNLTTGTTGNGTNRRNIAPSSDDAVIKFGSLNGYVASSAAGGSNGRHGYIEIGNLNQDDEISGNWQASNSLRKPYLRKVGTGTLTTYVVDTEGYILNGGTLIVMAAAAQATPTTEMPGYKVASEVTYDEDESTVLYTTYTLESTKITWTGEGNDKYWTTAANWSSGEVPTDSDFVVFNDGADVLVPTWATPPKCMYMTVNGTVTFTGDSFSGNAYCIDVNGGYIDGSGTITLQNCGLWNPSTSAIAVSPAIVVNNTSGRDYLSRIDSDNGTWVLSGAITVNEGAKLRLRNASATTQTITLGVGAWLSVASTELVTTGNINSGVYSETSDDSTYTTAYVNDTASTWIGGESGEWNTAANWSSGVVPVDYTVVTFPADSSYTIGISDNDWTTWVNRDKCGSMVANGYVTLANVDSATGGYLAIYGDISGTGSLTLNNVGLDNASWNPAVTSNITCPFYISSDSATSCWFASRDVGFNITSAGVYKLFNVYCPVTFTTLTAGEWINIGTGRTMTIGKLVVVDSTTVTLSPDDDTASVTVTSYEPASSAYSVTTSTDSNGNSVYTSSRIAYVVDSVTVPDSWQTSYNLSLDAEGLAGTAANGISYVACYALGLDPTSETDKPYVTLVANSDGTFTAKLVHPNGSEIEAASNVTLTTTYTVYESADTESGTEISEEKFAPATAVGEGNVGYIKASVSISAK